MFSLGVMSSPTDAVHVLSRMLSIDPVARYPDTRDAVGDLEILAV